MDGWPDILKVSGMFQPLELLINTGASNPGVFTQVQILPSTSVYMARVDDYNGDDRPDVYVVDDGQDYVLYNNSTNVDGTVAITRVNNVTSTRTANFGGNVHQADLDRDGDLDIGVADVDVDIPGCSRRFAALQNRGGTLGFRDPNNTMTLGWNTQGTHDFAWLDINGDGFEDMLLALCDTYVVYIMEPFAVAVPYGEGCAGVNGVPVAGFANEPSLGATDFQLTLNNAAPNVVPFIMLSANSANVNANGCDVLIDLSSLLLVPSGVMTNAGGNLTLTSFIPNVPELEDVRVFMQWAIPDASGAFLGGFSLSNGIEAYLSSSEL